MEHEVPQQVKHKFFTPGVIVLLIIALNGIVFIAGRFLFGLGAVTNLDQQYPWGIWIGIDVAAGVALAAGGFISAAIGHILHKDAYHSIVRPALLTAMLGYTFVAFGVFIDIGRWYFIWHPLVMWNPNSALFEVGICVIIYLSVLYIEFLPIVTERFIGKLNMKGIFSFLNKPLDKLLRALDSGLSKTMFVFIIAGVVLSSLHQSSLGTLMIIAGDKMHPLWQTPILPLLFLISAVAVGLPMVIFESLLASKSFKLKPEFSLLSRLGNYVGPILGVYLSFKIGDMVIRESFVHLVPMDLPAIMFLIEMIVGVVIPMIIFLTPLTSKSVSWLFWASSMVIFGVLLNRINNFIIAYNAPYALEAYIPSYGEISVTLGAASMLILLYRFIVINFPVISLPAPSGVHNSNK
ncbi:MAG: Ni/Fe-hydrogenase cytochrome b subunit [Desulfobulbaceae bacterium]|nr:Ni/Fe-hydrogenase cytochrome b subunit [Desulfobulbaceae bacterium]